MRPSAIYYPFLIGVTLAVNIRVSSSGGNATRPLQYGLMFELEPTENATALEGTTLMTGAPRN